ncbi:hypothetical protein CRE_10901 [Caenorhabditis remanei]|uniref:C-type lectin domain-containing protein n=1 Tax=Caenorhabditis remanei TaxID=31234 RepID=E3M5F1_CAERE|nr:hypothetical protein CRE_10901 [Caenorhabditis remanei]
MFNILVFTNGQVDRDPSFQSMCEFWNGKDSYRPRDNGYKSMSGDKCSFVFEVATDTEASARRYCEVNVPYHINDAIPGERTTCKAEATLICKNQWVQMFGRCYKITKELMTRKDAGEHCEKEKATIAFLHREDLAFRINEINTFSDYFKFVSRLWIDASEAITKDVIQNVQGGNLLLALDGFMYNLPNIALAIVDSSEMAMVLCEYTPPMNQAESNYLLKKYGEIYHPTIVTSHSSYIRTTSSLNRNVDDETANNRYCTNVLKPFIPDGKAQAAIPTRDFLNELARKKVGGIVRTSAFSARTTKTDRQNRQCVRNSNSIFHTYVSGLNNKGGYEPVESSEWRQNEPNEMCDGATSSTAIVLSHSKPLGLETMSDARYAPLYCQSVVDAYEYTNCPNGYQMFYRKELGQRWCHKYYNGPGVPMLNYDEAQAKCASEGAALTGYTSPEELAFLDDLLTKGNNLNRDTLIGAKRRDDCPQYGNKYSGGFSPDVTHRCSRKNVFEWKNGVAPNPPNIEADWAYPDEPNHGYDDEKCLVLLKGANSDHFRADMTKKLNDHSCTKKYHYICGMEAPIVKQ